MCTMNYRVYGWKTQTESTNWGRVYLYLELIGVATFKIGIQFTDKLLRYLFVLNFVMSGKVTSLHKVIKYVKRSKSSFHKFQRKTLPSATLNFLNLLLNLEHRITLKKFRSWEEHKKINSFTTGPYNVHKVRNHNNKVWIIGIHLHHHATSNLISMFLSKTILIGDWYLNALTQILSLNFVNKF